MQQLPRELVWHVLEYAVPPACKHPPKPVCRAWLPRPCRGETPVGCPRAPPLCIVHQQRELALWAELWQQAHSQHANPFSLRTPHEAALKRVEKHMTRHLPFDVIAIVTAPPPQEAWIWIAPGQLACAWYDAYRVWRDLPDDDV